MQRRRAIKEIADCNAKTILDTADAHKLEVQLLADKLRTSERARESAESGLAEFKEPPSLYPLARQFLTHLCNRYPTVEEVHVIAQRLASRTLPLRKHSST